MNKRKTLKRNRTRKNLKRNGTRKNKKSLKRKKMKNKLGGAFSDCSYIYVIVNSTSQLGVVLGTMDAVTDVIKYKVKLLKNSTNNIINNNNIELFTPSEIRIATQNEIDSFIG
jgi:hypothetical protein